MKFGIFFELEVNEGYTERDIWRNALDQIEFAEKMGFDSVYAVEHHFNPGYSHSPCPEILFAAASQRTKTMRMGTAVQLLPIAHPIRLAERIAAVDILTNGRYDFGIGRGAYTKEFVTFDKPHAMGETKELNRELWSECLEIIQKCWTLDSFTHEGKFYNFPEPISVVPKPVQKPHPPIFAATGSVESYELYPKMGYHIMPTTAVQPIDRLAPNLATAQRAWKDAGHEADKGPLQVNCLVPVHTAATSEAAAERLKPYELWYFEKLVEFFSPKTDADHHRHAEMETRWWENTNWDYIQSERLVVCGEPKECVEVVKEFEEIGVTRLMCQFQVGGMPHDMVMEALEMWGEEVIPACS